jgi:mercuric ion transport protein
MNGRTLVETGLVGAVVAAVCCFTPLLLIALAAVGLSALTGYLDYVLFPALAICLGMIGYGLHMRRPGAAACCEPDAPNKTTTRT